MQHLCRNITNILHIENLRKTLYPCKIQLLLTITRRFSIFKVNIA